MDPWASPVIGNGTEIAKNTAGEKAGLVRVYPRRQRSEAVMSLRLWGRGQKDRIMHVGHNSNHCADQSSTGNDKMIL